MIDFGSFDTFEKTSLIKKNHPQNDFDYLKEIFQIDEIGIIRLSKLVPEDSSLEKIFDGEFERKLDFYKNFLGLQVKVNVVQNEIFAGYKKVSIDIDGTINSVMWKHIFTQMLPELQSLGFQKSFISLSHVKDIPNEVFEEYMHFVNADFLDQKGNVVKDIILWLELAICTKLSQERGYGNPSEFLEGHENFQDALLNLAHLSKMDSEFQEKLEEMYVNLLRYKNPKIQSLLRMLGHNVNENIASKKLIAKTKSRFSIGVARILGSFGKKEEKKEKENANFQILELITNDGSDFDRIGNVVLNEKCELLTPFKRISELKKIFIERKMVYIQSLFPEDISKYVNGNIHFSEGAKLIGKAQLNIDLIVNEFLKTPQDRIRLLVNKNLTPNNFEFSIENIDLVGLEKIINDIYEFLLSLKEDSIEKEEDLISKIDIEKLKYNSFLRDLLKKIILSENRQKYLKYRHILKELSKYDTEIKGWYYEDKISKISSLNSIFGLLRTTGFSFEEMWGFFPLELKQKFFSKIDFLFQIKTQKQIEVSIEELKRYFYKNVDILDTLKNFLLSIEEQNHIFSHRSNDEIQDYIIEKIKARQQIRTTFLKKILSIDTTHGLKEFDKDLESFNEGEQKIFWEFLKNKGSLQIGKELKYNQGIDAQIIPDSFKKYSLLISFQINKISFQRVNLVKLFDGIITDTLIIQIDEKGKSVEDLFNRLNEINNHYKELFGKRDFSEEDFKKMIIENIGVFQNDSKKLGLLKQCMNENGYTQDKSFGKIIHLLSGYDEDFSVISELIKKYGEVKLQVEIDYKYGDSSRYNAVFKEYLESEKIQVRLFKLGIYRVRSTNGFRNTTIGVLDIDSKNGHLGDFQKVLNLLEYMRDKNINSTCKINISLNFSNFLENIKKIFSLLNILFSPDVQTRLKDKGIYEIDVSNIYSFNNGSQLNISKDVLDELESGKTEVNNFDSKLNRTLNKKETVKMQKLLEYIFNNN